MSVRVYIVVEDDLSEAVLKRLLSLTARHVEVVASLPMKKAWQTKGGKSGYGYIRKQLPAFNAAASKMPHIVLVDLDDRDCPPAMIKDWLGSHSRSPDLIVRVAVREVETWLLADQQGMADFLRIQPKCIPTNPERIKDPKRYIVRLAARSRDKTTRESLAPAFGARGKVGPYFARSLAGFVRDLWDMDAAKKNSESLRRALAALRQFKPMDRK